MKCTDEEFIVHLEIWSLHRQTECAVRCICTVPMYTQEGRLFLCVEVNMPIGILKYTIQLVEKEVNELCQFINRLNPLVQRPPILQAASEFSCAQPAKLAG